MALVNKNPYIHEGRSLVAGATDGFHRWMHGLRNPQHVEAVFVKVLEREGCQGPVVLVVREVQGVVGEDSEIQFCLGQLIGQRA